MPATLISVASRNAQQREGGMALDFVFGVPDADLQRLSRRLRGLHGRTTPIAYIAAFGSRTTGKQRSNSDLDIVVALASGGKSARENPRWERVLQVIRDDFQSAHGFELDVNVFETSEIGPNTKFKPEDLRKS